MEPAVDRREHQLARAWASRKASYRNRARRRMAGALVPAFAPPLRATQHGVFEDCVAQVGAAQIRLAEICSAAGTAGASTG
jgi:hypothetical protein